VPLVATEGAVIVKTPAAGSIATVIVLVLVSAGSLESVAFTVMVAVPAVVGVPLRVQLERLSPTGSVPPVSAQV
jgi:hypothetical protein